LVDRSDWFKIRNLVYGGREIVRSLYSSLEDRQFMASIVSWQVRCLSVSKLMA